MGLSGYAVGVNDWADVRFVGGSLDGAVCSVPVRADGSMRRVVVNDSPGGREVYRLFFTSSSVGARVEYVNPYYKLER
jgi:hypothetical protein